MILETEISEAIGVVAMLLSLAVIWSSFAAPSPFGRFKPVPWMLVIFACYNVLPFLVVASAPQFSEDMLLGAFGFYSGTNFLVIAFVSLGCITAGRIGLWIASIAVAQPLNMTQKPQRQLIGRFQTGAWALPVVAYLVLMFIAGQLLWDLRSSLLVGYHSGLGQDQSEVLSRGTLSTAFATIFVTYLFAWFANDYSFSPTRPHHKTFWVMTLGVLTLGLALLSLGGRLYVFSAIITFFALSEAQKSIRGDKMIGTSRLAGPIILLLGGAVGVGIWRGQGEFNGLNAAVNLLGEPMFVSISLASFFGVNEVPVLAFPTFLLADVVGILPSSLYPAKLERLFSLQSTYYLESPVGGLSGLASLCANFGWLGAITVSGLICFVVAKLSYIVAKPGTRSSSLVLYVIAVTYPLLTLCRDPFLISVYKNLLQNSLFWPAILIFLIGIERNKFVLIRLRTSS